MKIVKTLIATTLAFTAFSTFAAPAQTDSSNGSDNVLVSSQEQPVNAETSVEAAGQPTTAQPTTESAADENATAPLTAQPAQ